MSRLWRELRGDLVAKAIATGHSLPPDPVRLRDIFIRFPEEPKVPRQIPAKVRWEVWERDDFTCQKCCSRRYLTIDHIIPWSRGGTHEIGNLRTLCRTCNGRKKDKYEL